MRQTGNFIDAHAQLTRPLILLRSHPLLSSPSNATLAIFRAAVAYSCFARFIPSEKSSALLYSGSRCAAECGPSVSSFLPLSTSTKWSNDAPENHNYSSSYRPVRVVCTANRATARLVDEPVGFIAPGFDGDCEVLFSAPIETAQTVTRVALVASDERARTRLAA